MFTPVFLLPEQDTEIQVLHPASCIRMPGRLTAPEGSLEAQGHWVKTGTCWHFWERVEVFWFSWKGKLSPTNGNRGNSCFYITPDKRATEPEQRAGGQPGLWGTGLLQLSSIQVQFQYQKKQPPRKPHSWSRANFFE